MFCVNIISHGFQNVFVLLVVVLTCYSSLLGLVNGARPRDHNVRPCFLTFVVVVVLLFSFIFFHFLSFSLIFFHFL